MPRLIFGSALASFMLFAAPLVARAEEYRLRVVNIYQQGFAAYLKPGEWADGASGPGLDRLEAKLDRAEFPRGVLLYDRPLQEIGERTARAYGAARARGEFRRAGAEGALWEEVRWEGKPGERSVWAIATTTTRTQEVYRLALKGQGPLRQFHPFAPVNGKKLDALLLPRNFVWAEQEAGTIWEKHLSRMLDLSRGIAAVVAVNDDPVFADHVYLVVDQGDQPTTYKAVLVWRRREHVDRGNLEGAGGSGDFIR